MKSHTRSRGPPVRVQLRAIIGSPQDTSAWTFSGEQHTLKMSKAMSGPSGGHLPLSHLEVSSGAYRGPRGSTVKYSAEGTRTILHQPSPCNCPPPTSWGSSKEAASNPDCSCGLCCKPKAGWELRVEGDCILYQIHQKSDPKLASGPSQC